MSEKAQLPRKSRPSRQHLEEKMQAVDQYATTSRMTVGRSFPAASIEYQKAVKSLDERLDHRDIKLAEINQL